MSASDRLIDTNVLVYACDASEKARRSVARALLDEVWDQGGGVLTLVIIPVRLRRRGAAAGGAVAAPGPMKMESGKA